MLRIAVLIEMLAALVMIFSFSSQDGSQSSELSQKVTRWLLENTYPGFEELPAKSQRKLVTQYNKVVRKIAHFTEFAFLGFSGRFMCELWLRKRRFIMSVLVCVIYASADEFHQLFTESRAGTVTDVLIDSAGGLTGVLVAAGIIAPLYRALKRHRQKGENVKTTLVIMAAGIGSRYGAGIKQLAKVGPCGEIIMDYSIHDAIEAGFDKILFIIRRDIEAEFREVIGERIEKLCAGLGVEVGYAYQSLQDIPDGFSVPEGRTKPWGTGQAVLCCADQLHEPFAVINADDFYGKAAYRSLHGFLQKKPEGSVPSYCMAGFILKNTLSENGGVTRGLCTVEADGFLTDVKETHNIVKTANGAEADGEALDPDAHVSMNMWGLQPDFLPMLKEGFETFFRTLGDAPLKKEYLLPIFIGELLQNKKCTVKLLETPDRWFGVTYQADKDAVEQAIGTLVAQGVYQRDLFSDLRK